MSEYTSSSEFDLENRVQLTNEIPISRDYEAMHHALQNDTWKWLIGDETVEYNLPYGGDATHDAPEKIVNGVKAANYGQKPHQKWNSKTNSYEAVNPTGTRMEITGVLASEHDLFLHEIYRYLSCLYPDNPDWINLLTRNEFIDAINNAAAIVDYKPNNEFFEKKAQAIQSTDPEVEEFKLNLRNLTNNAERRKFYGSLLGYRMYMHDIYEDSIIAPVDKVFPLKAENRDNLNAPKNHKIDTFDERYQTLFRRLDWLGNNRDASFTQDNSESFGSYVVPGYEGVSFEFVSARDGDSTLSKYLLNNNISFAFYEYTDTDTSTGSLSDIVTFNVLQQVLVNNRLVLTSSDDKVVGITTSDVNQPTYGVLYKIKPFKELFDVISRYNVEPGFIYEYINGQQPFTESGEVNTNSTNSWLYTYITELAPYLSNYGGIELLRDKIDYAYNPFIKNTIMLPVDEMLNMYQDSIEYDEQGRVIEVDDNPNMENLPLKKGDIVAFEDFSNYEGTGYEVTGATFGYVEATMNLSHTIRDYNEIRSVAPFDFNNDAYESDDGFGMIVTTSEGEKILLEGSLRLTWGSYTVENATSNTVPIKATFYIKAIPEKLKDFQYTYIYGTEYNQTILELENNIKSQKTAVEGYRKLLVQEFDEESVNIYDEYPEKIEALTTENNLLLEKIDKLDDAEQIAELKYQYDKNVKLINDYQETYNNTVKNIAGSNFEYYTSAIETLVDYENDLAEAKSIHETELYNKNKIIKNDISMIRRGCTVEFAVIGKRVMTGINFLLDNSTITQMSFGNISVEPLEALNCTPVFFNYNDRKLAFAKINATNVRDVTYHQLYSNMFYSDRRFAYTSRSTTRLYNEETYEVKAQVYVNKQGTDEVYELQFLSDDAKEKYDSLTVGTTVLGNGIQDSTYIVKLSNYVATLNKALPKGGTFTFTFKCPVTTSPAAVSTDPFNYKKILYQNNEYDKVSFFDKGLYGTAEWPNVSSAIINGDLNKKTILNPDTFFGVVKTLYSDKLTDEENTLIPSLDKTTNDVFIEYNIKHLIKNIYNKQNETNTLMNVEWLDYLTNEYNKLFLAKENVNVGANLILETDTSGYASLLQDSEYTDPNLRILFQTNNWDESTIPVYAQIGDGGSNMKDYFKLASTIKYPNVYGATFYDKTATQVQSEEDEDTYVDSITGGHDVTVKKRNTYASVSETGSTNDVYENYQNIDHPLFEIPLNEYNINLKTDQNNKTYTTIDIMFYEHSFKNITKKVSLTLASQDDLSSNLITGNILYNKLGAKNSLRLENNNILYYYMFDNDEESYSKGDLLLSIGNTDFVKYSIECDGCVGDIPYYVNGNTSYRIIGNVFNEDKIHELRQKMPTDVTAQKSICEIILMIKAVISNDSSKYSEAMQYIERILSAIDDNSYDEVKTDFLKNFGESFFENKLLLFTYFPGLIDNYNSPMLGLKNFSLVGLIWNLITKEPDVIGINKNYMLCTTDIISKPNNITDAEYNLFYGYCSYTIISRSIYDNYYNDPNKNFNDIISNKASGVNDESMDLSNTIINYSQKILNIINLPRKNITDGSYSIDLFIDPKFTAYGYCYDKYLSTGEKDKVKYFISQSAIKYDSDNNEFYTTANTIKDGKVSDGTMRVMIDFAENKYFKNLKWIYGEQVTRTSQSSGSSNLTEETYITPIQGINFDISDLSTQDKIVYAKEVSLRSPYMESFNNVLFSSTHSILGEIYGITDNGDLIVSGKRGVTTKRIFDTDIIKEISDITPATYINSVLTKTENESLSDVEKPRFIDFNIKKSIQESYSSTSIPEFKYFKNLLVFEGLVNLLSPNIIEAPNSDTGVFSNVLSILNAGDSVVSAVALNGTGTSTHTIVTNIENGIKSLAYNNGKIIAIDDNNDVYKASNVLFSSINSLTLEKDDNAISMADQGDLIDLVYDDDLNSWVVTFGLTEEEGEDFYGDKYYTFMRSSLLNNDGGPNISVYSELFKNNSSSYSFQKKSEDNQIEVVNNKKYVEFDDEKFSPIDVAIKNADDDSLYDGPYIVNEDEYNQAGSRIYQKLFTDNDINIVLQQEYLFVKTKSYLVDDNGDYTTELSSSKHWKAAKLPITLDKTMSRLKSKTVSGNESAYDYVKNEISEFMEWADKDVVLSDDGTTYKFTDTTLEEPQSKEAIDEYREALRNLNDNLLTYDEFLKKAEFYTFKYENNTDDPTITKLKDLTYDTYGISEDAVYVVRIDTGLPLNSNMKIDTSKSYILEMNLDNGLVSEAGNSVNSANFEAAYYEYLYDALVYVRGDREYDIAGAKLVKDIYSYNGKLFFRLVTGDIIYINKESLYKASDIENQDNWNVSSMPLLASMKMWRTDDLKRIGGYDVVEVVVNNKVEKIAVNNREYNAYFFKITSDLFVHPDGQHMFFGGYSIPLSKIKSMYETNSNKETLDTSQEWIQSLIDTWLNDDTGFADSKKGKTKPFIMYSEDGGKSFVALPLKGFIDDDLFTDGNDYNVKYFSYDETTDSVLGHVDKNNVGYTTRQIVISFDEYGAIDTNSTQYTQVSSNPIGEIKTFAVDDGAVTYATHRLGYGTDIISSQTRGSNTFNFDYTGNNIITIPDGLSVSQVVNESAIRLNKAITEKQSSGKYRVLLAISTSEDIADPSQYLPTDTDILKDYITSSNIFKVPTYTDVNNYTNADRIYMSKYFGEDDLGYPTVDEDVNKVYYEYDDAGNVVELTNDFGNSISLCSIDGDQVIMSDGTLDDINTILANHIDVSNLKKAGKYLNTISQLSSDISVMKSDDEISTLFKNNSNITIDSFDSSNLTIAVAQCGDLAEILEKYGISSTAIEDNVFDYNALLSYLEDNEDTYESENRFCWKKIGEDSEPIEITEETEETEETESNINEPEYLFDRKFNTYVFKNQMYLDGVVSIPYTFYNSGNGATTIADAEINYNDSGLLTDENILTTGIYYHPAGYGGIRNNTSLVNEGPWDRDAIAFNDDLLKNSFGDYVYIVDAIGNKIKIFNSIQYDNEVPVDYNSFKNDGNNSISIDNKKKDYFKLSKTDIKECHSSDTISENENVIIRFYKNGERLSDVEVVSIKDSDDNEPYDFTFENNILALVSKNKTTSNKLYATFKIAYNNITENIISEFKLGSSPKPTIKSVDETDLVYLDTDVFGTIEINNATKNQIAKVYRYEFDDASQNLIGYRTSNDTDSNVSFTYDKNVLTINVSKSINSYSDIIITYNRNDFIKLPIINVDYKVYKNDDTIYFGDMPISITDDNTYLFNNIGTIIADKTIMPLNYKETIKLDNKTIIEGLYGYSISKKPKYSTFRDLIYNEGYIINSEEEISDIKSKIAALADDNSEFKLSEPIKDGNSHYYLLKVLTVSNQATPVNHMNDKDYYYELDVNDIETYPPNRVWYNPNGAPLPPIEVNGSIFNSENNYAYYDDTYRNGLSLPIYLCNEEGRYINYNIDGTQYVLDPNNDGDCSRYVYTGVDGRYASPKPINASCKDWFRTSIYSANKEVNPLWQIIHTSSSIKNRKWVQNTSLNRYKKANNTQVLSEDIDNSYIKINDINYIDTTELFIKFKNNSKTLNCSTGEYDLLLSKGNATYEGNNEYTKFGLNFFANDFDSKQSFDATLQASYTVNTKRDFSKEKQDDSTIVNITEMGLFNKYHNLIAYAQFPPIEYRTDKQHLSFIATIYYGNMVSG